MHIQRRFFERSFYGRPLLKLFKEFLHKLENKLKHFMRLWGYVEAGPGVHAQIMKAFRVSILRGAKRAVSAHMAQVHILKLAKSVHALLCKATLYTVSTGFFQRTTKRLG